MKKILLATTLGLSLLPVFAAADTYDVAQFDISGMKLGMNAQEIKAALKTSLEMGDSDITREDKQDHKIQWEKGNHKVEVHFIADLWHGKADNLVADEIRYILPYTGENLKNLYEAAVQKYGKPTQEGGLGSFWCTAGGLMNGLCINKEAELALQDSRTAGIVYLTLTDTRYKKALQETENKAKSEKPKI